ncbi:class I adenylate-forming enzyme family protein [Xanthobacteraceae bacterium A53D]
MSRPTIGTLLRETARRHPDLPFLVEDGRRQSFAAFDHAVDRLCAGLLRLGIGRGDHVAIWLPNIGEWVLFFAACGRIGAVAVPVNTRYKSDEVRYVIERSDAKLLVMLPRMWRNNYVAMLNELAPEIATGNPHDLRTAAFPALRRVVILADEAPPGMIPLRDVFQDDVSAVAASEAAVKPENMLLICYTSGTTGKPKGVMHSHHVIRQSTKVGLALGGTAGGSILGHMPFYHSAGLFMAIIPAMALGMALVPMLQWEAGKALDLIADEKITAFGGIPTHFYDMVHESKRRPVDTASVRAAWIGGASVMKETFQGIKTSLGLERLLSTYGMTENTISTSFNAWDDPDETCCRNCAPLLSDCEVRVVDPELLADVKPGREGEIWCRGDTVMMGYYKDPDATQAAITTDKWLRTGDLGTLDREGYLTVTARLKEMLKVGGTNTSPIEIEQVLASHPGIRSSVVVGAADERLGQVPYAFIQAGENPPTAEDVVAYCKARLADYKVPRFVTFVDEFPRTATGKIQRMELSKAAHEILSKDQNRQANSQVGHR